MENIYHTIRGRTTSPRTLESISKDPLSAAKPYIIPYSELQTKSDWSPMVQSRFFGWNKTLSEDTKHRSLWLCCFVGDRDRSGEGAMASQRNTWYFYILAPGVRDDRSDRSASGEWWMIRMIITFFLEYFSISIFFLGKGCVFNLERNRTTGEMHKTFVLEYWWLGEVYKQLETNFYGMV